MRTPLETIAAVLTADEVTEHRAWRERLAAIGEPPSRALRFASWYRPAVERWVAIATEQGLWGPNDEWEFTRVEYCHRPDDGLEHHTGADRQTVHLEVEEDEAGVRMIACYCRTAGPAYPKHTFTEEQRLSWEEFIAGTPCRGCGRGFAGGPEWKPTVHRTAEEQVVFDAEEAAFRALHPDCSPMRWTVSGGGITHCSVCCPPPPFGPEQSERIARLLVDMAYEAARRDQDLERRWLAAGEGGTDQADGPVPAAAVAASIGTNRPIRSPRTNETIINKVSPSVFDAKPRPEGRQPRPEMLAMVERIRSIKTEKDVYEVVVTEDEKAATVRQQLTRASKLAGVDIAVRRSPHGFYIGLMTPERRRGG